MLDNGCQIFRFPGGVLKIACWFEGKNPPQIGTGTRTYLLGYV